MKTTIQVFVSSELRLYGKGLIRFNIIFRDRNLFTVLKLNLKLNCSTWLTAMAGPFLRSWDFWLVGEEEEPGRNNSYLSSRKGPVNISKFKWSTNLVFHFLLHKTHLTVLWRTGLLGDAVRIAGRLGSFYIGWRAFFLVVCPHCPGIKKLQGIL